MSEELNVKHKIEQLMSQPAARWMAFALFLMIPGSLLLLPLIALVRLRANKGGVALKKYQ